MRVFALTALAALSLAAPVAARAQDPGALPADLAQRVTELLNDSDTRRYEGNAEIESGDVIEGDVAVLDGGLRLDGRVEGDVVVVNGGLTFNAGSRASATALVNRVGRRIVSASEAPLPDIYEEARTVVDLSVRFPVTHGLSGRIDAKNLLDAGHEVTQGTVIREAYHTGRVFQIGFNWTL